MIKVGLISLGCPKNQVDSEIMLGFLSNDKNFTEVDDLELADVIVINTCGFIQDAKEESIETILEAGQYKSVGNCKALIVTGCLTQRYREEILENMPEVDAILGTGNFDKIIPTIKKVLKGQRVSNIGNPTFNYNDVPRKIRTSHFAYVKIAEGCDNRCTYCSIPYIRGKLTSRPIEDIYNEVVKLGQQGIKEIILVAQDTTQYGKDIYGKSMLLPLLKELVEIDSIKWIRLLYCYPERITDELLFFIAENNKICNYLDLPIQHSSNKIRRLMNRKGSREELINLIKRVRELVPDIVIRTSLIVGFPGETDEDFNDLFNFVKEIKFDRLGVFKYSREENTPAASFPGQISEKIKDERYNKIMEVQQKISRNKNQERIGEKVKVLIDELTDEMAIGRTQYDAPEIDNQVYVSCNGKISEGDMILCRVTEAYEYDLLGECIYEFA
ncbi:30S ribosomal protein S12 methylthiotransferase RimO [Halothermothrix orenii]|uniref:Ribosomal protein uS12 methylthiotransferase RimO n=1 Tax=Halothermothrix orenii (strain H 168 / OCM 544 / DSM 9562) TaxID=373903 RepID=B8CXC8_HALOH|nr:30S ribosomal protein S12 methylthiotransferase RimO [Halothermothrix orenii]ACL69947.1 MiaB-like tRNA modifying enzyme [Halothermothrix orenii H 168]